MLEDSTYTDAAVVALSRGFHWVEINRDHTPDIVKYFNVSAYPSLITIGNNREKIHRFSGYQEPGPFMEELRDARRRYDLYRGGQEWDEPDPRPDRIMETGTIAKLPAPSDAVPSGMTLLDGDLWVAQQAELFRLDPATGSVRASFTLPSSVRDLCTDGQKLYGAEYGWSAGKPIHVIDPATGEVVREIVTEANKENSAYSTAGIAWLNGSLYVLSGMQGEINEVDPNSGEVRSVIECDENWLTSLDTDGTHFVVTGRQALMLVDPETGAVVRSAPTNYSLRSVAWQSGAFYLMEQPIFGYDKQHQRVQIWPRTTYIYRIGGLWPEG